MARLKQDTIHIIPAHGMDRISIDIVFFVNKQGEFYCEVPDEIKSFFTLSKTYSDGVLCQMNRAKKMAIYATSLNSLENILKNALKAVNEPTVTQEHVIRYNIESHVSFAENSQGEIVPNAGYPDSHWPNHGKMFGDHNATNNFSRNGYSLCIGAKAMTKITTVVGEKKQVEYKMYYQGASHLGNQNPAQMLNSWTAFTLPDNAKEIPYTNEAALFFHNLMFGMAKISKQIQEATFQQNNLLELIESGTGNLLSQTK